MLYKNSILKEDVIALGSSAQEADLHRYQAVFLNILEQALKDAAMNVRSKRGMKIREEASRFLREDNEWFMICCSCGGISPEVVIRRANKRIAKNGNWNKL
jgi:hypothetical protein